MENGSKNRCPEISLEAPNKRIKTLNQENSPSRLPSPSQSGSVLIFLKGKAKLEPEIESNICGICLTEAVHDGNNACRGYIDSCDHYFCFVCIMEWAKIESKCPLCKCRFSTIRRPSKPPLFPCERLVHIPVRDQFDYLSGSASAGHPDIYANVECTVCHSSADESFLLLCDLCDSASHTHCVGLGATVPEGDWFCRDCTLLRAEHIQSELDADSEELRNTGNIHSSSEDVTVFDILRVPESPIRTVERISEPIQSKLDVESGELSNCRNLNGDANSSPENLTVFDIVRGPESPIRRVERSSEETQSVLDIGSSEHGNSRNPDSAPRDITVFDIVRGPDSPIKRVVQSSTGNLLDDRIGMDKRGQASNVQDSSRVSARTLQQRHNVLDCIQALRDNWNGFRSGSLNFSSCSSRTNQTHEVANHSAKSHSMFSLHERWNSEDGSLASTEKRGTHEIDKAWKMMHMAKSLEQKCGRKSTRNQASKSSLNLKHPSTSNQEGSTNLASIRQKKQSSHCTLAINSSKHKTQTLEQQILPVQGLQNCSTGLQISSLPVCSMLTSSQNTGSPLQYDLCGRSGRNLPKKTEAVRVLSATSDHCCQSVNLSSSAGSAHVGSNLSYSKLKLPASSSCKGEAPKCEEKGAKESHVDLKKEGTNDAKSEIQSLVKLNLKLLNKDKHLGVNAFKEIARSATHSILAACGLEHPKPDIRLFPSSACSHASEGLHVRRSTLMPNSCRECFYVFVKDVVSTIMLQKAEGPDVS